jgi:hypothetical protein
VRKAAGVFGIFAVLNYCISVHLQMSSKRRARMRVSQILLAGGAAFLLLFQGLSPNSDQQIAAAASSAAGNAAGDVDPDAIAALDR